jgi:DNA-binding IclR family transcriptional regulator
MLQSVQRAFALLEQLGEAENGGRTLAALAAATGLKPPTAHNLLRSLIALGYASQDPASRRYALGPRAAALARPRDAAARLAAAGLDAARALQARSGETVVLALLDDGQRRTVLTVESPQLLRVGAEAGADERFAETATGQVLLGRLDEAGLAALPPHLHPRPALRRTLARVRRDGQAVVRAAGGQVRAVAVPVPLADAPPAAIGLYYPAARHSARKEREALHELRAAAAAISHAWERSPA